MVRTVDADQLLPGELALSVDGGTAGRAVEFAVGAVRVAVKYVVGRNRNQPDMVPVARRRHHPGTERVEPERQVAFALAPVHRSHRGTVNHRIRPRFPQQGVESGRIGDVRLRQVGRNYFIFGKFRGKGAPEHPAPPGEKYFHCSSISLKSNNSASASRGLRVSFGDRMKESTLTRQSIPSSGSSKAIPRSCGGL